MPLPSSGSARQADTTASTDVIVNPYEPTTVPTLTAVPQNTLLRELAALLKEREGWASGLSTFADTATAALSAEAKARQNGMLDALRAGSILFQRNSAEVTANSTATLDELAEAALACGDTRIEIAGHTDSSGGAALNQRLSQARAETVMNYLVENGVPGDRLDAVGYGEAKPIAPNTNRENRAKNRRIEFVVKEPCRSVCKPSGQLVHGGRHGIATSISALSSHFTVACVLNALAFPVHIGGRVEGA